MAEDGLRQPDLTDNARRIFDLRYSRKDEEGNPTETPADAIKRVAENVAISTVLYLSPEDNDLYLEGPVSIEEFPLRTANRQYEWKARHGGVYASLPNLFKQGKVEWRKRVKAYTKILTDLVLVPNSPTWTGAGTPLGQYAACFPAGTPVMTERGLVPIEVIEEGDLVLTHEGRYRPVTEIFSRIYVGDLVRIDPIGRPSFESTPEHPIYVEGSNWVMSSDIVKGDQLRTPVDQTIIDLGIFDLADLAHDGVVVDIEGDLLRFRKPSAYQNSGSKPYWSNRFVTADRDLSLLMGYYCAEGSLEGDGIVRFTFGKHEKEYVEEVVDLCERIVGITPNISESSFGEWITINLYSRPFAMWAKQQFGQYSHGKSIPRWLQQADLAIQRSFLTGIFRGDGLWGTWSGQESLRITLANPSLIAQLSALIGRQGWKYSWRYVKPELARHETAQLSVVPSSVDPEWLQQTWPTREGSLVRPGWTNHGRVRAVSRRPYQGMVYNIEVEEDHSYVVEGVAVHNCFVLPIDDDLGRSRASIFETMKVAALIQQTGGGNGFDFSSLRPKGALVKASMGQSSGPVSFLKAYDAAFESIGQGGCLAPETLVMTSDGTYRLDELVTHEGWRAAGGGVWTDDGERRLLGTYNNGVAEVLRVTSDLPDLVGTPNHKVKVMTDTGPEWRRLDQLSEGDAMLVTLGGHAGSEQSLISPDRLHYNQKMPDSFPDVVDEKFAWVLGYLAGDGFVSKGDDDHRVGFSVAHSSYLIDELPAMLNSLFPGIPLRIEQKPNDASVTMVYSCRAIKDFLTLNGLGKGDSHEVSIPLKVRMSPPVVAGAFLAGLFEADGGISSGYPMLGSTSRRLVDEVSTLCIGLGIPVTTRIATASNDRFGSREMYQVRVASHYGLAQWIKCVSTHPLSRFAAIDSWVPDSQRESAYVLPCPSWWITPVLDAISVPQRGRGGGVYEASSNPGLRRKLLRYIRGDRRFTLSAYRNLSLEYEEFALHARPVDGNYFSLVCEVQDAGMIPTFDLTVEDNHTYTAYGIVTHNTRRGANMAILRCLSGDTMVHTIEGQFPIRDLVGTQPIVYACDPATNEIHVVQADQVFISDSNRKMVRVWLDNDEFIDCTPDHRFLLKDGSYREAGDLNLGDSLKAFGKKIQRSGYNGVKPYWGTRIGVTGSGWSIEHRVIAQDILGIDVEGLDVHHLNENPRDNRPENLEVLSRSDHGKRTPTDLDSHRQRIASERKGRTLDEVYDEETVSRWKENMSVSAKKRRIREVTIGNHKVVRVEEIDDAPEVFDISLPLWHNFVANGVFVHNCDHPDVEEFINAKIVEGEISNFNISVAITDDFMDAIEMDNAEFSLRYDSKVIDRVNPKLLWEKLVDGAWTLGDPGVYFVDRANAQNPCPTRYTLAATNPCITGDTLVSTANGWVPVSEIIEGEEITTVLGTGEVKTIETHESVPVFEVKFSDGGSLRATAAHQFHARGSSTKFFTPTRLDELEVGQWVRVAKSPLPSNLVCPDDSRTGGDQRLLGFMAGVMAGDGSCSPKTVALGQLAICSSSDDTEWNDVLRVSLGHLGFSSSLASDKGTKSVRIYPQPSREFTSWFVGLPMEPSKAPDKVLPSEYINSNRDFLVGLVDGLFSTDGNVNLRSNHPQLRFDSASEEMVKQLRLILLMFGVHGRVSRSERNPAHRIDGRLVVGGQKFTLTIAGESFGRFADQITLSNPDKQAKIDEARLRCNFTGGNWAASVVSIEPAGREKVYDLYEPVSDTWVTEGYVSRGCGEQSLPPYSNCCLGAIAVNRFVKDGKYDWKGLANAIQLSTEFLDDVVDANRYVPEVPELEQAAMNERRIGLGIMGLADALLELGLAYDDRDGQDFVDQLMEFFRYHTMLASIERAKERGAFPWIKDSIYDPALLTEHGEGKGIILDGKMVYLWSRPISSDWIFSDRERQDFGRPVVDWDLVFEGLKQHGIRNACQTTIAPTGTTSNVAGLEGSGCEPLFALAYQRRVMQEGEDIVLDYFSPLFEAALDAQGIKEKDSILRAVVANNGSCRGVEGVPAEIQRVFVVASDIAPIKHVEMQAICQSWIDNAISKTINLPNEATREDVANIYLTAWELGCKGTTIYRQGSRDLEVLSAGAPKEKIELTMGQEIEENRWPILAPMPMPEYVKALSFGEFKGLPTRTFEIETPRGTVHAYVTELRSHPGRPFDIRLQIGKAGNDTLADVEALGRTISAGLRTGVGVEVYVEQLEDLGGRRTFGFGPKKVTSIADGVSKLLRWLYLSSEEGASVEEEVVPDLVPDGPVLYDTCPHCQNATVVYEAGCAHCEPRLGGCGTYSACD